MIDIEKKRNGQTYYVVRQFQKDHRLEVDGRVGPKTKNELEK